MPALEYNTASTTAVNGLQQADKTHPFPMEQPNSYAHIATATTTVVKSGAGVLHLVAVNTTAAGLVTIFDNTAASGTTIAILKASVAEGGYRYDVAFTTGLTILTAAASDLTVSYH